MKYHFRYDLWLLATDKQISLMRFPPGGEVVGASNAAALEAVVARQPGDSLTAGHVGVVGEVVFRHLLTC